MFKNSICLPALATAFIFVGCASNVKKADIPSTANPREEISRVEAAQNEARTQDVDVLAKKEFKSSEKALDDAKSMLAKEKKQEKILDDVRISEGYLNDAKSLAAERRAKVPGLLDARQAAIKAGVWNQPELRKDMEKVDDKVSDKADNLMDMKADKIADVQQTYVDLERRATVLTNLGPAMARINGAKRDKAEKRAPNTLKTAEVDVKNAESVISTNVRNPEAFRPAVAKANESSTLLLDVVTTINQNGKNLPEATALKMVEQNRKISGLEGQVDSVEAREAAAKARLSQTNQQLAQASQALSSAEQTVAMQKALEDARKQFSANEAEAYQQGNQLVIRLKNVNFASGRADLPSEALPVLAKVTEVAKTLHAEDIKVEGHTDSTGTKAKNEQLSTNRAAAVATYLKTNGFDKVSSEGYGFDKPIATNKTKEGRAQNRRVDIVISPAAPSDAAPSSVE